ncbi:T6SS immunity protein Tli3 family protein [Burkholderia pyrrocinia]|uniref:T6SS immunity protein Tli3 family protein n=1 Tax=Burkholderia pyrrocinia TaxID=60550 RepID=UPI00158963BA|nr:hypothetical protein [Burkholderia pyrrocinia]
MNRYFSRAVSALGLALLTACASLILPGIPSGMADPAARGTPTSAYPEHFAYRIDDHRYITIQGNRNCEGQIWYYDTRLGVRTAVAATGLTLGDGAFGGYYAINSEYVAIPAIVFSQTSGVFLYIYYSYDGGRTFKSFWAGADVSGRYSHEENVIVLNGKFLYIARKSREAPVDVYLSRLYDVSHDIPVGDDQHAIKPEGQWVDPHLVPLTIKSPSGSTKWSCGPATDPQ